MPRKLVVAFRGDQITHDSERSIDRQLATHKEQGSTEEGLDCFSRLTFNIVMVILRFRQYPIRISYCSSV